MKEVGRECDREEREKRGVRQRGSTGRKYGRERERMERG